MWDENASSSRRSAMGDYTGAIPSDGISLLAVADHVRSIEIVSHACAVAWTTSQPQAFEKCCHVRTAAGNHMLIMGFFFSQGFFIGHCPSNMRFDLAWQPHNAPIQRRTNRSSVVRQRDVKIDGVPFQLPRLPGSTPTGVGLTTSGPVIPPPGSVDSGGSLAGNVISSSSVNSRSCSAFAFGDCFALVMSASGLAGL